MLAAILVVRGALGAPDGVYARADAEVGVQQLSLVQVDQTAPGYGPSAPTARKSASQGGVSYGGALAIGAALAPRLVLAARGHLRVVDLHWGDE
jgi:hypothetical protein